MLTYKVNYCNKLASARRPAPRSYERRHEIGSEAAELPERHDNNLITNY